jgi:hypothetical protein
MRSEFVSSEFPAASGIEVIRIKILVGVLSMGMGVESVTSF